MKIDKSFFHFLILLFIFGGGASGAESDFPERIVSLGPALTEGIYLLGAEGRLVGRTIHCTRPKETQAKEAVGTVVEVNLEKIASLRPDLVLVTALTSVQAIESFEKLGIPTAEFPYARNFSEICSQFRRLGELVGKEAEAAQIIEEAEAKVAALRKKTEGLPKQTVFLEIGARPLVTVTRESFVNDFIEYAGGVNIARDAARAVYSREAVLQADPDTILVGSMGINSEVEKAGWQKYPFLKAVRNGRVLILDSELLGSPTPLSFAETLEMFQTVLQSRHE